MISDWLSPNPLLITNPLHTRKKSIKLGSLIATFLFLIFAGCLTQMILNIISEEENMPKMNYPIKIEFGALCKGSNLPTTTFEINKDLIWIWILDKFSRIDIKNYTIKTSETKFEELLSGLEEDVVKGEKHYYNPYIRDGGYMTFTSKLGQIKFSNTFSGIGDKSDVKPDTIGLFKFEIISKYANSLLKEIPK